MLIYYRSKAYCEKNVIKLYSPNAIRSYAANAGIVPYNAVIYAVLQFFLLV